MNYDEEFIKLETENFNILNKTFNIHLKQVQNQKAIECLKEIRQDVLVDNCEDYSVDLNYLVELINNKIKELEGD